MQRTLILLALSATPALLSGCETSDPTLAVIDNEYAAADAAGAVTVYTAWWSVAAFFEPIPAGGESAPVRVVKGTDFAYALLARAWEPQTGAPAALVPVRSRGELTVERGATLHIRISPSTIDGDCATGAPLPQEDADFITQRIFPGEFSDVDYDAATCSSAPAGVGSGGAPGDGGGSEADTAGTGGRP
jgi:hypothetical protein